MGTFRLDPLGVIDILAGILLFFTLSTLPSSVAKFHAAFLIFKGAGTVIRPLHLPLPVFVLGGAADVMSAAILFTGRPPILASYKAWIAGFLFLKGVWSLLAFMQG